MQEAKAAKDKTAGSKEVELMKKKMADMEKAKEEAVAAAAAAGSPEDRARVQELEAENSSLKEELEELRAGSGTYASSKPTPEMMKAASNIQRVARGRLSRVAQLVGFKKAEHTPSNSPSKPPSPTALAEKVDGGVAWEREGVIIKSLEPEILILENENTELENKYRNAYFKAEQLAEDNAKLQEERRELTGAVAEQQTFADERAYEIERLKKQIKQLIAVRDGVEVDDATDLEMTQVSQEDMARDVQLAKIKHEATVAASKYAITETKLSNMREKLEVEKVAHEETKAQLSQMESKIANAEISTEQARSELEQMRQQYEALKERIEQKSSGSKASADIALAKELEQQQKQQEQLAELRDSMAAAQRTLVDKDAERAALEAELNMLKTEGEAQMASLMEASENDRKALQKRVDELTAQVTDLASQLDGQKGTTRKVGLAGKFSSGLQATKAKLAAEKAKADADAALAAGLAGADADKANALAQAQAAAEGNLAASAQNMKMLGQRNQILEGQVAQLNELNEALEMQIGELEEQLEKNEERMAEMKQAMAEMTESLEQNVYTAQSVMTELQTTTKTMVKEAVGKGREQVEEQKDQWRERRSWRRRRSRSSRRRRRRGLTACSVI